MAKTEHDLESYYDITDKARTIGICSICDSKIYEDMEHYNFYNEFICLDCKDEYVNDNFYRN